MAETIKGLTISIGADTKKFQSEIKKVDKDINETSKQATTLQKSLQIEYDSTKFSQAQKLAQDALTKTEQKAQALRDELKYLEETGTDPSSEKYKKLQTQLVNTEAKAVLLKQKLEEINSISVDRVVKGFNDLGGAFTTAGQMLTPLSVAVTGVLAGVVKLTQSTISTGATFDDLSQQINLSAEELQKWQYIAMQTGLDNTQLQTSLTKVQAGLADLASGTTSTASTALQELGFTAEQASKGMSANFELIIQALSSITDPVLQASYANEIFGDKLGSKLLPLLNAGGEQLQQLVSEFESLGYMTNEQVSSLATFDDMLNRIKYAFTQVRNEVALALLPVFQELADYVQNSIIPAVQNLADKFSSLSTGQQKIILAVSAVVASLGPALLILGKLTTSIGSAIKSLSGLPSILDVINSHPIIATITTIIALLGILYSTNEEFRESINSLATELIDSLTPVLTTLLGVFQSLYTSLSPIITLLLNSVASILVPIINTLTPLISLLGTILNGFLTPIGTILKGIFTTISSFLTPLINTLIPILVNSINAIMSVLQPLFEFVNNLLGPAFEKLGEIIERVFGAIPTIINVVLKFIEDMVNGVIDFINSLTGGINSAFGFLGVNIGKLEHVSLQIPTTSTNTSTGTTDTTTGGSLIDTTQTTIGQTPGTVGGDVINNDYSNKDITINVTVENYAEEVDVDDLVQQINLKLAEQM